MTFPSRLQVSESLVTLARASGTMEAFAKNPGVIGDELATECADMAKEVDAARETLRLAAGVA